MFHRHLQRRGRRRRTRMTLDYQGHLNHRQGHLTETKTRTTRRRQHQPRVRRDDVDQSPILSTTRPGGPPDATLLRYVNGAGPVRALLEMYTVKGVMNAEIAHRSFQDPTWTTCASACRKWTQHLAPTTTTWLTTSTTASSKIHKHVSGYFRQITTNRRDRTTREFHRHRPQSLVTPTMAEKKTQML